MSPFKVVVDEKVKILTCYKAELFCDTRSKLDGKESSEVVISLATFHFFLYEIIIMRKFDPFNVKILKLLITLHFTDLFSFKQTGFVYVQSLKG